MPEPRRIDRGDLAYTLAAALVALVPRLFVAVAWAREPVWDGHYYHFGATRIAAGLGYSEDVLIRGHAVWKPWCHYPVGLSGLLGGVYKLFGSGIGVAPVVNALLGTLTVALVHRLARQVVSERRARMAAAIAALHPGLIAYSAVVMSEPLATTLLVAAAFVAGALRPRALGLGLAGLSIGLATLVRPSSLLAAPLLVFLAVGPWWKRLVTAAAVCSLCVVVVLPWTVRNCRVMDGCAFVSTNGGWNLAIGALYDSGRFETLRASDGCPIVTGQVQQDRCWAEVGMKAIAQRPLHWLSLVPKKLGHTYDHESFAIEYLREANPSAWPEDRRVAGRGLLTWFHRLLLCAAALGTVGFVDPRAKNWKAFFAQASLFAFYVALMVFAFVDLRHPFFWIALVLPFVPLLPLPGRPRQWPTGRYLLALVAATSATHAVFFGDDRYHLVVTPLFCILAAAALRAPGEIPAARAME